MDMSMDGSPIIDRTPVDGLYLNCRLVLRRLQGDAGSGWCFAHTIARGRAASARTPPMRLDRFATGALLDEKGAGAQPNLH